jgi:AMP deaminase
VPLADNPFPDFFKYGMNVTLSTDDPLQFHSTAEVRVG